MSEWITLSEKSVIESPVLSLYERECRSSEDNRKHRFYVMRARDWCNIIPITEDGKVVMVKQYRVGISAHTLEIPGGVTDPEDENVMATAIREMIEETGYFPLPDARCQPLGWTYPNPAIQDNRCYSFVIGPVRREAPQKLDPGEMIEVIEVPIEEIPRRIAAGEITHALMLNTFFFLELHTAQGASALRQKLESFRHAQPALHK